VTKFLRSWVRIGLGDMVRVNDSYDFMDFLCSSGSG